MKSNLKYFILLVVALSFSCKKDFEEINQNPAAFTTASDGSLFNQIQNSIQLGWNEQFYINNEILYKQTQLAALYKEAWGNSTIGTEEIWSNYYTMLPNFRELEKRFSNYPPSAALTNMSAIMKILLAYKTFRVTDYFGSIPYSEAGYAFQDASKLHPKFDGQREIYLSLLNDLKWAEENINTTAIGEPFTSFKTFDKLFNGNLANWRKFANSLRLRYAIRMYDKEPVVAGAIVADIINNNKPVLVGCNFSGSLLETATLYPYKLGFKNESKVWSFREHKSLRMGSSIWKQLSSNNSADGSGIFDIRAYYFFETNNASNWVAYPQLPDASTPAEAGVPYEPQRNQDAAFSIKGSDCLYSPFNFFLISDEEYIPEILMTGAEVHFLKAEAYMRGIGVAQSENLASNEYLSGIQASLDFWKETMTKSKLKMGSDFFTLINIPSYLNINYLQNIVGFWNYTTNDEKLRAIYIQQWIDLFKQPAEAYSLVRRVGAKIPREGAALNFFRFTIPPSEVQYNQANYQKAFTNGDLTSSKLWWMP